MAGAAAVDTSCSATSIRQCGTAIWSTDMFCSRIRGVERAATPTNTRQESVERQTQEISKTAMPKTAAASVPPAVSPSEKLGCETTRAVSAGIESNTQLGRHSKSQMAHRNRLCPIHSTACSAISRLLSSLRSVGEGLPTQPKETNGPPRHIRSLSYQGSCLPAIEQTVLLQDRPTRRPLLSLNCEAEQPPNRPDQWTTFAGAPRLAPAVVVAKSAGASRSTRR